MMDGASPPTQGGNAQGGNAQGRKARGQGASRRGEILDAARRLFLTDGFEHTTIRKIAAVVGVSSATLYLHFPDKDAMLQAIADSTFGALLRSLEDSQRADDLPLDRFRAGLRAYVAFGRARPDEYRLVFLSKMIASSNPGRAAGPCGNVDAADRSFAILQSSIEDLITAGLFAPGDPVLLAESVWACLHGVTTILLDKGDHVQSDPDALIETVAHLAVQGLMRPIPTP